jgi:hypothetical protein
MLHNFSRHAFALDFLEFGSASATSKDILRICLSLRTSTKSPYRYGLRLMISEWKMVYGSRNNLALCASAKACKKPRET